MMKFRKSCEKEYLNQMKALTSVAIGETGVRFIDGMVDARFVGVNSFMLYICSHLERQRVPNDRGGTAFVFK
jgi:hypothetical protein